MEVMMSTVDTGEPNEVEFLICLKGSALSIAKATQSIMRTLQLVMEDEELEED